MTIERERNFFGLFKTKKELSVGDKASYIDFLHDDYVAEKEIEVLSPDSLKYSYTHYRLLLPGEGEQFLWNTICQRKK